MRPDHDAIRARFDALAALLTEDAWLWQPRPFVLDQPPWAADLPDLIRWLDALDDDVINALNLDPFALPVHPDLAALRERTTAHTRLTALPKHPLGDRLDHPALRYRVPDRKWRQLEHFTAHALPVLARAPRIVDWCSGKGHLGRALACATGLPVAHLERQHHLCVHGAELARRALSLGAAPIHADFVNTDVLTADAWRHLDADTAAVGLHACGVLTDTLLLQADKRDVPALAVAPCCPHVGGPGPWRPISNTATASPLRPTRLQLRLAIYDERVATPTERAWRRKEQAWRLAVDLLLREATGRDDHIPAGDLRPHWRRQTFEAFAREAAERVGLPLPARFDPDRAEAAGVERARRARARAIPRGLYRRPMELCVIDDRALFLIERGWSVRVGLFCPADLTPRNILVTATR